MRPYYPYRKAFPQDQRRDIFVTGSVKVGLLPMAMCLDEPGYVERLMMTAMGKDELRVMQWVLGNSVRDPVDNALVGYIQGAKGGEGTTTIVNQI